MTSTISNSDDMIDSRDVIARIEELESSQVDDPGSWTLEDHDELMALRELASDGEDSPDWTHGETLIRESYFTDYIRDLINECYEMPKEFGSGSWPYRHMTIDYEAAAEEAKVDYSEVDFDGVTYLIRS